MKKCIQHHNNCNLPNNHSQWQQQFVYVCICMCRYICIFIHQQMRLPHYWWATDMLHLHRFRHFLHRLFEYSIYRWLQKNKIRCAATLTPIQKYTFINSTKKYVKRKRSGCVAADAEKCCILRGAYACFKLMIPRTCWWAVSVNMIFILSFLPIFYQLFILLHSQLVSLHFRYLLPYYTSFLTLGVFFFFCDSLKS